MEPAVRSRGDITAVLTGLSMGRAGSPVRGGGVFVAGAGDAGGRLLIARLETGEVHGDGGIAPGTPERIWGGVFTVSGAIVDEVRNRGPVARGAGVGALELHGAIGVFSVQDRFEAAGKGFETL